MVKVWQVQLSCTFIVHGQKYSESTVWYGFFLSSTVHIYSTNKCTILSTFVCALRYEVATTPQSNGSYASFSEYQNDNNKVCQKCSSVCRGCTGPL